MAGRQVKIHRGRLDKKILADRAQLLQKKYQKRFLKFLKIFEKHFHFFGWGIWKILKSIFEKYRKKLKNVEKSRLFSFFDPSKMTLDFSFENKKNRNFSKFFKISIQKNENIFRDFLKFLKIFFDIFFCKSCARSARIFLSNLPRWISISLPAI